MTPKRDRMKQITSDIARESGDPFIAHLAAETWKNNATEGEEPPAHLANAPTPITTEQAKSALHIMKQCNRRSVGSLIGPGCRNARREIIQTLTGERPPLAQCGVTRLMEIVKTRLRESGFDLIGCDSEQETQAGKALRVIAGESELLHDARELSAGTIAHLTGKIAYSDIDDIRNRFVRYCQENPRFGSWMDAWEIFWGNHPVSLS